MKKEKEKEKEKEKRSQIKQRVDNLKFCPYSQKSLLAYILLNLLTDTVPAHVRRFDNRLWLYYENYIKPGQYL